VFKKLLIFALIIFCSGDVLAANKSYSISSVNIGATVNNDGSMMVEENRQYDFNGSYTFAYQYINKKGVRRDDYQISNFKLCDEVTCYKKLAAVDDADITKPNKSFYVVEETDRYYIKWFYSAIDSSKNLS
jgi:hypothetical protein